MKQEITFKTVQGPEPHTIPVCPYCTASFKIRTDNEKEQTWIQNCTCEPKSGSGFNLICGGDLTDFHMVQTFYGPKVGESRFEYCKVCKQQLQNGETAAFGRVVYDLYGYAHPDCYAQQRYKEETEKAEAEKITAKAKLGPSICICFSPDDETVLAPNTGHLDLEARVLPTGLPKLPAESVVYEILRRPFAMNRIEFANIDEASQWWETATQNTEAAIELCWFNPGETKATKSWNGNNFAYVESRAKYAELQAEERN